MFTWPALNCRFYCKLFLAVVKVSRVRNRGREVSLASTLEESEVRTNTMWSLILSYTSLLIGGGYDGVGWSRGNVGKGPPGLWEKVTHLGDD